MASFLRNHGAKRPMPLTGRGRARKGPTRLDALAEGSTPTNSGVVITTARPCGAASGVTGQE